MEDPSSGVPHSLLPHVHLVSTYRWPTLSTVSIETIVDYLVQAPKITKEVSAMHWMFLNAPPDGTVMLVWQPLAKLGERFASDGYVWADPETLHSQEYRGYTVEMFIHRSGYNPPHETISTHQRRRYRLTPAAMPNPNLPHPDPALWIVHYSRAEQQNQFPVNRIPVNNQVQAMMAQRRGLQQHGQLVRKEFMLEDRNNWPTINPPPGLLPQYAQQMTGYPGNVISHLNRTQQQAYMQNPLTSGAYQGMGPSPAKRQRQAPPAQRPGSSASLSAGAMAHDPAVEGEEDYALGDYMDLITPREISTERYKQHHDWMAEIISSPYATSQIMPVDLGIGRRGELESLTRGFFKAPVGPTPRDLDKASVAAQILESGRAEEFAKRATDRIAQINAEMGKMKRVHAKRMAKIGKSTVVKEAEKRLRSAVIKLEDSGMQPSMTTHFDTTAAIIRQQERVDEIAQEVETAEDLKIEQILTVKCVQKGGLEEKDPLEPKLVNEAATATSTTIDDSLNGPLPPVDLVTFSDFDDKTDWLQGDQGPDSETVDLGDAPLKSESHNDMQGPSSSLEAHNQIGDSGDWVIVNKQGGEDVDTTALDEAHRLTNPDATNVRQTELDSLAGDLPEFSTDVHGLSNEGFDSTEFDDTVDFGNLDTAGDALAAYGEPDGTVGNDDQLGLLEDSAFGDAFHHTDPTAGGEEGHP